MHITLGAVKIIMKKYKTELDKLSVIVNTQLVADQQKNPRSFLIVKVKNKFITAQRNYNYVLNCEKPDSHELGSYDLCLLVQYLKCLRTVLTVLKLEEFSSPQYNHISYALQEAYSKLSNLDPDFQKIVENDSVTHLINALIDIPGAYSLIYDIEKLNLLTTIPKLNDRMGEIVVFYEQLHQTYRQSHLYFLAGLDERKLFHAVIVCPEPRILLNMLGTIDKTIETKSFKLEHFTHTLDLIIYAFNPKNNSVAEKTRLNFALLFSKINGASIEEIGHFLALVDNERMQFATTAINTRNSYFGLFPSDFKQSFCNYVACPTAWYQAKPLNYSAIMAATETIREAIQERAVVTELKQPSIRITQPR